MQSISHPEATRLQGPVRWAGRMLHGAQSLLAAPGAAAARRLGSEPRGDLGEREVSVLFADLRGYSRYAEQHRPSDVFRVLDAYANRASEIVRGHGGWVLSFHGDGLLAIFGALDPSDKERSALGAARSLVRDVTEEGDLPCQPATADLPVGIGIATGHVFVGRLGRGAGSTWSATGDPTNVAARLQEFSRVFGTPIVLDRTTFRRSATPCTPHHDVSIRGRSARMDLFTPLATGSARRLGCAPSQRRAPAHAG